MKNFQKFIENLEENFKNSNIYFFDFLVSDEIFNNQNNDNEKNNQISEFLIKNLCSDFLNHYEVLKIKISSDSIISDYENLLNQIENIFQNTLDLFDFQENNKIIILNFFFEKDSKHKNILNFFSFLHQKFLFFDSKKQKLLIFKETNSQNSNFEIQKNFMNFFQKISNIVLKKENLFRDSFKLNDKKQIIKDLLKKNEIIISNQILENKMINSLILKNLFFIGNLFLSFSLKFPGSKNQKDIMNFVKKTLDENENQKIFNIFELLLKENSEQEFIHNFEKIYEFMPQISIIRSFIYFFLKNNVFFERKIGFEKFSKILDKCFEFEKNIKTNEYYDLNQESKKSFQRNFIIQILNLIFS
jgi:hypothetical protein